ncbi:hypothetical protein GCM10007887_28720 [Methylobacterium haplocladii]|uniref:Uncharacterized protein n=1 Tax=Methylobacterium haplocladii TaxID=1176176 RepID=A0A512ILB3_9HYPH|nr:hypothetical protein MHA02_08840 [Methylobacterium haplocladii]GJD82801.1 hypothetical protein HPGCJGGD_0662 [Methylobacterium haplocladii]GLS60194.1 hypothetical protein GCM10007887_28720 [Methylobacterium haplocladii]
MTKVGEGQETVFWVPDTRHSGAAQRNPEPTTGLDGTYQPRITGGFRVLAFGEPRNDGGVVWCQATPASSFRQSVSNSSALL